MITVKDLERLLDDSSESTSTAIDELSFIRLMLRCMTKGMTYSESLQHTQAQINDMRNLN